MIYLLSSGEEEDDDEDEDEELLRLYFYFLSLSFLLFCNFKNFYKFEKKYFFLKKKQIIIASFLKIFIIINYLINSLHSLRLYFIK
jgi:hypothetical protein